MKNVFRYSASGVAAIFLGIGGVFSFIAAGFGGLGLAIENWAWDRMEDDDND